MTDAGPPTTIPTTAPAGDMPRLPDAAPAPTPTPSPTPDPHAEPAAVELEERPAPKSSGTPVGFFVLMLIIVGAIVAIAAVVRPWESSPDAEPATSVEASAPSTTPATTSPATSPTTVPATTTPPTTEPESSATTILVVAPLPTAPGSTDAPLDPFEAQTEACATEGRTLAVAVEAFLALNAVAPSDPEELVTEGLLRPHPDGWSTRWMFAAGDGDTVSPVPVPGGACDL